MQSLWVMISSPTDVAMVPHNPMLRRVAPEEVLGTERRRQRCVDHVGQLHQRVAPGRLDYSAAGEDQRVAGACKQSKGLIERLGTDSSQRRHVPAASERL